MPDRQNPPTEQPCSRCGTTLLFGTSEHPYCPHCERAYHALEERYRLTGQGATVEEVLQAMTEDGELAVTGVTKDGQAIFKRPATPT